MYNSSRWLHVLPQCPSRHSEITSFVLYIDIRCIYPKSNPTPSCLLPIFDVLVLFLCLSLSNACFSTSKVYYICVFLLEFAAINCCWAFIGLLWTRVVQLHSSDLNTRKQNKNQVCPMSGIRLGKFPFLVLWEGRDWGQTNRDHRQDAWLYLTSALLR